MNPSTDSASAVPAPGRAFRRTAEPAPERTRIGGYPIRIDAEGQWYYHDSPIRRKELIHLFASVLRRDESGEYWLVTPGERGRIIVEEVPFLVVDVEVAGQGADQEVRLKTNLDEWIAAGPEHPIRVTVDPVTGEPRPYILLKDRLEARIARPVYYEMVERGVQRHHDGEVEVGLWSRRTFFVLGTLSGD